MRFILRCVIHETQWRRQLAQLLPFCRDACIQEVMLMEQSHQLLTVPFPLEKHRCMASIYAEIGKALRAEGIEYSVNIATLVGHSDMGYSNSALPFHPFVGEDLKPASAVYCIMDADWVEYAAAVCAIYADTHPQRIMIDDDFRSLNHTTMFGCFCPLHAHAVSELLHEELTSADIIAALTQTGEWQARVRNAWLTANAQAQYAAAKRMQNAVHDVDPRIQVGLMNSGEPWHAVQGRKMGTLLRAFAGETQRPLTRPAGGSYADGLHEAICDIHQISALSRFAAGDEPFYISEVENFPHTRYTKSLRMTQMQILLHALWGADAISLNVFDYLATPFSLEPEYAPMLKATLPKANIVAIQREGLTLHGVTCPWHPYAARHTQPAQGALSDLLPKRPLDTMLPLMGIPVQFADGDTVFLAGDIIRCFDEDTILGWLAKGVILDAAAAAYVCELGLEAYIGCAADGHVGMPCAERLCHAAFAGVYDQQLMPSGWFALLQAGTPLVRWQADDNAMVISELVSPEREPLAPATILFQNALGGRVCVLAGTINQEGWMLHRARSYLYQAIIRWMTPTVTFPMLANTPNLAPFYYCNHDEERGLLCLVNCGLDSTDITLPPEHRWYDVFTGNPCTACSMAGVEARFFAWSATAFHTPV